MTGQHPNEIDEYGEPLRRPQLAAGGSGSGSGGGRIEIVCMCGSGKLLATTNGPSMQNIVAGLYNQLSKSIRTILPFGQVPVCEIHRWK